MSRDWTQEELQNASKAIESAVSSNAKETAYDKLKRMILNDTASLEIKKAS